MSDYVAFHTKSLTQEGPAVKNKYIVYVCKGSCGGLGDRIHGIIQTFYVALLTNRIFLIGDNMKGTLLSDTLSENLVRWNTKPNGGFRVTRQLSSMGTMRHELINPSALWTDMADTIIVRLNHLDLEQLWGSKAMQVFMKKYNIDPLKQPAPPALFKWAFDALFIKSPALDDGIKVKKRELGIGEGQKYVSIHMRIGTTKHWHDPARHAVADAPAFLDCARRLRKTIKTTSSGQLPIFLASDNDEAKAALKALDNTVKITDLPLFHIDRSRVKSEGNMAAWIEFFLLRSGGNSRVKSEGNMAAWIEFFLLAESHCLVNSKSGFSEVAIKISMDDDGARCSAFWKNCTAENIKENIHPHPQTKLKQ